MMHAIILAAGEGTRMKSDLAKPMHTILKEPMLYYVLEACKKINMARLICVVGHKKESIEEYFKEESALSFVSQPTDKTLGYGTGFAVMCAKEWIAPQEDYLILCGDAPLIRPETLQYLIEKHQISGHDFSLMSAVLSNPIGYGRILREEGVRIVEERDANESQRKIQEINTGIYIFKGKALLFALDKLSNDNPKNEYYLTDAVEILSKHHYQGAVYPYDCEEDILGVNDCVALHEAGLLMQKRINYAWMGRGVRMLKSENVFIGPKVVLEEDTYLGNNVALYGHSVLGKGCSIHGDTTIENSKIGQHTQIDRAVIKEALVGDHCVIGPYTYIRPQSKIGNFVKLGDFVEVKNSNIGDFTKASHLAYIGDADLEGKINVGCGVVFVNYDGEKKYRTKVAEEAFIGSNSNLVAPVTIGKKAYIAAGSTITEDVGEKTLSIARARQVNKANWVRK